MPTSPKTRMIVPLVVACAYFMENFDGTVITTALPAMAVSLHASAVNASVGITAYMLAVAVCIPMSGWAADRYGNRSVFRLAIVVFMLASAWCATATRLDAFVAARVLQGIGGAMMVPVGRLIVLRSVDKKEFVRAMSIVTVPGVIGQVLGPPVGGFLANYLSWRWIFYVNIPVGLIGVVLVSILIDNVRSDSRRSFDWWGALLVAIALGCLVLGLDKVTVGGSTLTCMTIFSIALVSGVLAVRHLRRCGEPLLELSLLRVSTFATAIAGGASFRMSAAAMGFLLPLLLQIGFGMNAFNAGILMFFSAMGAFLMKAMSPPILRRFGFRHVLLVNGCLSAISIFLCVLLEASTPWVVMAAVLLVGGVVRSLQFASLNTVVYADVPPPLASAATSFASMVQPLASGAGVAFSALLLRLFSTAGGAHAAGQFEIRVALGAAALVVLLGTMPFRRLAGDAGAALSGHGLAARPE
ncbi:EmrB/QacA family drug resistance transporter [Paraburkholderia piptadeniae]|uniref:EmrB/QacA family drug resistance transporter n=2 Tax=Paraburkholderia piptadeniae TaxID=1701573 RepID=A0A1N7SQT1_9BURK|nr:EmrB/QacA family drug resistance transporter [Paraburkholderia piptadeniae]